MLILHDSAISKSKLLIPVPKKEWMTSSLSTPRDQFGNETVKYMFAISAKSNDGLVVWKGWFDDREDADAFLWAIVNETLKYERALWDLPTPSWQPYMGELITYEFATFSFLTTAGTIQTFNVPTDFNSLNNTIHCVGAGGWGGKSQSATGGGFYAHAPGGGGGGAYARKDNVSLIKGGTCQYLVASSTTTAISANSWFNGVTGTNCCVADSGDGSLNAFERTGTATTLTEYENFGGRASLSIGDVTRNGGNGGNTRSIYTSTQGYFIQGAGGGGSAGYYGAGGRGGQFTPGSTWNSAGGGGADGGYSGRNTYSSSGFPAYDDSSWGGDNRLWGGTQSSPATGGRGGGDGTNGGGGGGCTGPIGSGSQSGGRGGQSTTVSYWNSTYGVSGGSAGGGIGGGTPNYTGQPGIAGVAYGGAAGGASIVTNTSTNVGAARVAGSQGLIVVEYTPAIPGGFNSPMLGM